MLTEAFVDIHCHVIPALDDGPDSMDESVEMCRMAYKDGTQAIVATPHVNPGLFDNNWETINNGFNQLVTSVKAAEIPIQLYVGADVRLNELLMKQSSPEEFITINKNNSYMLLEFPDSIIPPNTDKFLFELKLKGITPVFTHPERNYVIQQDPNTLYHFVNMGMLVQITAMSLTGMFGAHLKNFCELLLTHNLVHVVASDAHSKKHRPPVLGEAFRIVSQVVGEKKAVALFSTTPKTILEGLEINPEEPKEITSGYSYRYLANGFKKFIRWFDRFHNRKEGETIKG